MKHWRRWMTTIWKTRWSKHVLHLLQAHQVKIYHCPPTPPPPSWLSYPKFMILHQHIWEAFVPNSGSHIGKGVNRAGDWTGDGGTGATYPSSPARAHQILLNLSSVQCPCYSRTWCLFWNWSNVLTWYEENKSNGNQCLLQEGSKFRPKACVMPPSPSKEDIPDVNPLDVKPGVKVYLLSIADSRSHRLYSMLL